MENIKNKYPEIPIGRATDMTGERYGRLTALYRTKDFSSGSAWLCLCDCGEYLAVRTASIRSGNTQSCGCLQKETASLTFRKNLTGQTFNMLTALKPLERRDPNGGHIVWRCVCECGNETDVASSNLIRGHTKSCGCLHKNDLIGQTFGKLTVIKAAETKGNKYATWLCSCECGGYTEVISGSLTRNLTQSCGCITGSIGEENIAKILRENDIEFIREQTFDDLRNPKTNGVLRYDFAIFKNKELSHIIEFDGVQHFEQSSRGDSLEDIQYRDNIKNQYCKDNNIPLIRIPYWKRDEITLEMLMILEGGKTQ